MIYLYGLDCFIIIAAKKTNSWEDGLHSAGARACGRGVTLPEIPKLKTKLFY